MKNIILFVQEFYFYNYFVGINWENKNKSIKVKRQEIIKIIK